MSQKRTALISVSNKEGIVEFATALVDLGWELLASGGTASAIADAGLPVRDVAEMVGGGAILGHKVVTLSREVHAGLLADYDTDREEMEELGIPFIDLLCVDFYPLEELLGKPDADLELIRSKTDIGGPAMLRSAAKGRRIVIGDVEMRNVVLSWLRDGEPEADSFRHTLATRAEQRVSDYCECSYALLASHAHELYQAN